MNEKPEAAMPEGLEEAPTLRLEDLANADLKGQDLTKVKGLLPEHLAGADLIGAKLPDEITKFPALSQVAAISSEARKIFIGLLAACVYSWLVIGTTRDVALILNTASSPLPIINTPIPTAGFYVVGGTLLAAVYCYLHFYLQRLWRTLATLPASFPDGTTLDDKSDPWLLTNLVRTYFERLRANAPPLARLENLLAVFLAWWLVPITLLALWTRYLPAHAWLGTTWLVFLTGLTTLFGRHTYRLARAALQGEALPNAGQSDRDQGVLARAWHEFRHIRPDRFTVGLIAVLIVCSLSAFRDNPRDPYTWVAKGLHALNFAGIRTYADLREVNVAERPDGWDGKDWSKVKRVDLSGSNLAFADATGAILTNADLRHATLTDADLRRAQLEGADLSGAQLQGADLKGARLQGADLKGAQLQGAGLTVAQLQGADLRDAQLQGADLKWAQLQDADLKGARLQGADLKGAQLQGAGLTVAQLQGADLRDAQLQGADLKWAQLQDAALKWAQLQGADLSWAQLQGAGLSWAQLQGADLTVAQLQGADLSGAQLQGADLRDAQLQGADLRAAQLQGADLKWAQLQGADLRAAALWRALVYGARWDHGDLRGADVQPTSDADIDTLIAEATKGIPDEASRKAVAERLNTVLRTEERPARPNFPEEWRSMPNVVFDRSDPTPEPFDWGPLSWATQDAYDEDLATFLGDLACASEVREALTRGVARRASGLRVQPAGLPSDPKDSRNWPKLVAARLIGPDCPPAKGLSADMRSELEALAARRDTSTEALEASPQSLE